MTPKDITPLQPNEGSGIEEIMEEFDTFLTMIGEYTPRFRAQIKVRLYEALTTIEKEAYRRGVLAALEKVPGEEKRINGTFGWDICREEAIKNIRGLL